MPNKANNAPPTSEAGLPRPQVEVITSKTAMPAVGGELDAYVRVTVGFPPAAVDRKPLNLALVIDRSGSMSGQPIEAAKLAAHTAVGMLLPGDWVSVVAFDGAIEVPVTLRKVAEDKQAILDAIALVDARGSTDLYGGWAEGLSQLLACPESDAVSRVVILSDGQANQGVTDVPTIASDVSQAVTHGVTTTAMGLSAHYDENLLRSVADAGNGNYVFLESPTQVVEAFENELAGLGALRGRNVKLTATGQGVGLRRNAFDLRGGVPTSVDEREVRLPDLVAGLPIELVVSLTFEAGANEPGLVLSWDDAITAQRDEERLPLGLAPVDAATFAALAPDPAVAERRLALEIAATKLDLSQVARTGDMLKALTILGHVESLVAQLPTGAVQTAERHELAELRHRVEQRDAAMTARFSEKFARDRFTSRSDISLKSMRGQESESRRLKLEAIAARQREQEQQFGAGPATGPSPAPGPGAIPRPYRTSAVASAPKPASGTVTSASQPPSGTVLYAERIDLPGRPPVNLEVVQGDITLQSVDAIVNSSNRGLFGSTGVDGAIHRRAGPTLKAATQAIGSIGYGEAVFTSGYDLPAQYVIHVAAPAWGTTGRELQLLAQCYEAAFTLADRLGVRSLALPAIGTGNYRYPIEAATHVAATVAAAWLTGKGSFETVRFVVLDAAVGRAYLDEIRARR